MKMSTKGRYAVMAMIDIGEHSRGAPVSLAEIAERNGLPGYSACDGALHRIIAFALRSLRNPEEMAALAGFEQLPEGELKSNTDLAWLEIYFSRFAGVSWSPEPFRPLSSSYLGGNLTQLYSGK